MNLSRALRLALTPGPLRRAQGIASPTGRGEQARAPIPSAVLGKEQRHDRIAFIGAGGKTTAMFQLARELSERTPVIVTATTHLGAWQIPLADHHIIVESPQEIGEFKDGVTLVTGALEGDRTRPLDTTTLLWLHETTKSANTPLLVEADGARQKPLKAPAAHEPPIPDFVDTAVVVAGLSGLEKPLDAETVHRPEIFARLSGLRMGEPLTPEAVCRVLLHVEGGLKNIPAQARRVALLNQADTPELQAIGGKMARQLLGWYDAALVGALPQNCFCAFEQIAGIVLAAGESKRFGKPKQVLDWNGKPFVRQVAETALHAGLRPVVVVTGADAAAVESALTGLDVKVVRNEAWQSGQASSIASGIQSLPKNIGGCVFLLADQPQVSAEVVRALAETHAQVLPPILAPLVLEEQRANPVLFDCVTFPDLLSLTGDVGGRAIFGKYKVEFLPWHDDALLLDVDTPEDYERLVKQAS